MTHHLADLDTSATDDMIARAIAGHLLNTDNPGGPFKLAYQHEAKDAPPPHSCDRIIHNLKLCVVDRKDKEWCRTWILEALGKGLYVSRYSGGSGFFTPVAGGSIKGARHTLDARKRMAEFDATRVAGTGYLDDEIPF